MPPRSRGRISTSPGPANNAGSAYGMNGKGPTGASIRTLLALTEVFSEP